MRYLYIFLLSLAAFLIHGYQFAVSDQEIFIPYVYKYQDPALFTNDQIFNQISAKVSLFYPTFGVITKYIDIQSVFFFGYLVFNFVFFIVIYQLAKLILNDNKKAYLSLFPFFLPKFIGGTATFTFDTFFGYRSFGVIFLILFLTYLLKGKFVKSGIFAGIGILFHPLSIVPSLLLLPSLAFTNSKKGKKVNLFKILLCGCAIVLSVFIIFGIFSPKNDQWLSTIKLRDDYLFLSLWKWPGWAAAAMYFFITLVFFNNFSKSLQKAVKIIIVLSLAVFVSYWFTLEILKTSEIAKLQLLRSVSPLAYIGLIVSPLFLFQKNLSSKVLGSIAFLSLCLNIFHIFLFSSLGVALLNLIGNPSEQNKVKISKPLMILFFCTFLTCYLILNGSSLLPIENKIQYPKLNKDWQNLQTWAQTNTQKSEVFLVPPNQSGFRIFSKRPIVGDIKDGAVVMYDPTYASYWSQLISSLSNYQTLNETDFLNLKLKYNFTYIVTNSNKNLYFDLVYKNVSYSLYKI